MEKDDELNGEGNSYYTHHRLLDTRIGKWLSNDPEFQKYPDMSPYSAFANNPIIVQDVRGDTIRIVGSDKFRRETLSHLQTLTNDKLEFDVDNQTILITKLNGANEGRDLKFGTGLIRELNKKDSEALPTVTIMSASFNPMSDLTENELDNYELRRISGNKNAASRVENIGNAAEAEIFDDARIKSDGKPGKGSKSNVYFNRHKKFRGNIARAKRFGLVHELFHALINTKGLYDPKAVNGIKDLESGIVNVFNKGKLTNAEILTRFLENIINREQKAAFPENSGVTESPERPIPENIEEKEYLPKEPIINQ